MKCKVESARILIYPNCDGFLAQSRNSAQQAFNAELRAENTHSENQLGLASNRCSLESDAKSDANSRFLYTMECTYNRTPAQGGLGCDLL